MLVALAVFSALLLDYLLGEPKRWHPLVGFGTWVKFVERSCYRQSKVAGVIALSLLLLPLVILSAVFGHYLSAVWSFLFGTGLLYLAIGRRSLAEHALAVANALNNGELNLARERVGYMVSRDTAELNPDAIASATVESVLENGNDAVFAAVFWFLVAGAPGVILYRLSNTLDAMWGYKNERYLHFGWAAARLDDILNFIPARLTALSYALLGNTAEALHCWRIQGFRWKSPNAGPVMASGAASLGLLLGGTANYGGKPQQRPPLGAGRAPEPKDITASVQHMNRVVWLWLAVIFCYSSVIAIAGF